MGLKVSIFGLGYVGSVTAVCFAKLGHQVIAVDKNKTKVDMVRSGMSPIYEPGLAAELQKVIKIGSLSATCDGAQAVNNSEISLVSVGTYSSADGFPDLRAIYGVMDEIGDALKNKKGYHSVVIRSTVLPGTTEVAMRRVEKRSGRKCSIDFGGGMNPEFLREGEALSDFVNAPFVVSGTTDKQTDNVMRELYKGVNSPYHSVEIRLAEIMKYLCNSFHALKIAFANEAGRICSNQGVDSLELMRILVQDRTLNISEKYLRPGVPFGGSCLPKDLRGFASFAASKGVEVPLLHSILASNDSHFAEIIRVVEKTAVRSICVLGIAFKPSTDDVRESPALKLVRCLIDRGFEVKIYDRNLFSGMLVGSNRELLANYLPEWDVIKKASLDEATNGCEMVVVTNGSYANDEIFVGFLRSRSLALIDLDGSYREIVPPERYHGLCW